MALGGKRGAAFRYLHVTEWNLQQRLACVEKLDLGYDILYLAFGSSLLLQPAGFSFSMSPDAHFPQVALTVMANNDILGKAHSQPNDYEGKMCICLYPWGRGMKSKPASPIKRALWHMFQQFKNELKADQNQNGSLCAPLNDRHETSRDFCVIFSFVLIKFCGSPCFKYIFDLFSNVIFFLSNLNTWE